VSEEDRVLKLIKGFFPYPKFRPFQVEAVKFSFNTIFEGKIGLLSSPCGTGKSISVLSAYFAARSLNPSIGRLIVLVRTKSQLEIYSRELKSIKGYSKAPFTASIFKSRREMCPYASENPNIMSLSYRDFLQYCRGLRKGLFGDSCRYYDKTYSDGGWRPSRLAQIILERIRKAGPVMPEEVYDLCRDSGLCPYEITKVLAKGADIIIGNYNYVLVEAVRNSTLSKAGVKMKNVNCIFDEAHSLPYYASGILSNEISLRSILRAIKEGRRFGLGSLEILEALYDAALSAGKTIYREYGLDYEHIVSREYLVDEISKRAGVSRGELSEVIEELSSIGEYVRQVRVESGGRPISYTSRCASFLAGWLNIGGSEYIHYVKVEGETGGRKTVKLGIKCLDPSLATDVINEARSAILMSGTLWNFDYYIDVLGLNRSRCVSMSLPNPFPPENRLIIVDMAVTTKFEERGDEQWEKMANHIAGVIQAVKGRVAIYFPSYDIMHSIAKRLKLNKPLLIEGRDTRVTDVLRFLRENNQCVLLGVARGKISEGVDMSINGHSMLSTVIIAGLPFPKRTEAQDALQEYLASRFGDKANEYANDIPCLNALAQSAGRLIRGPEDRGVIVIMDRRAARRFKERLPEDWRMEIRPHINLEKILSEIEKFINKQNSSSEYN
jgi:DNA excision repair protein ERCC-2